MTVLDQLREVASDVFGVPTAEITPQTSPETLEAWDSVQHLSLALAIESRFGVVMEPDDIEKMKSIGATAAVVERKLASR